MKRLLLSAALAAWCGNAMAQGLSGPIAIVAPLTRGCAVVTLTTATTTLNAANVTSFCSGTTALPSTSTQLMFYPQPGSSDVTICLFGATTCTVGMVISAQQSVTKSLNWLVQPPSVTSAGTATLYLEWAP